MQPNTVPYICGITSAGNESNLKSMIEPLVPHIAGLCFTYHRPIDSGSEYLESRKGSGAIVYADWCQRHGYSMTHFLWQGPMIDGQYFLVLDSMERLSPTFMQGRCRDLISLMEETRVAMVANYGKGLLFRYNEQLEFRGSPHWYATGLDGPAINVELDQSEFWNVRREQRDKYHWVMHYAKYWLYPAGSNHALLGLEKQGDPNRLFGPRESRRLAFRQLMRRRGYPLTLEGLKAMLTQPLDEEVKTHLRAEKTLSDVYWLWNGQGHRLKDTHMPSDALPIL